MMPSLWIVVGGLFILAIIATIITTILRSGRGGSRKKGSSVLLVGPCNAGKTLLLSLLKDNKIRGTTISTQVNELDVEIQTKEARKKIHVIDFPGNLRLRSGLEKFVRLAKCIIFMIDASSVQEEITPTATFLYSILTSHAVNENAVSILILGNKCDLHPHTSIAQLKTMLESELDKIRKTSQASISVDQGEDDGKEPIFLGVSGKPFTFDDLPEELNITFAESSLREGKFEDLTGFIANQFE